MLEEWMIGKKMIPDLTLVTPVVSVSRPHFPKMRVVRGIWTSGEVV